MIEFANDLSCCRSLFGIASGTSLAVRSRTKVLLNPARNRGIVRSFFTGVIAGTPDLTRLHRRNPYRIEPGI